MEKSYKRGLSGKYVFLSKTDEAQVLQKYEANRVNAHNIEVNHSIKKKLAEFCVLAVGKKRQESSYKHGKFLMYTLQPKKPVMEW